MDPNDVARLIDAELQDALADPHDGLDRPPILQVEPPAELSPETAFRIEASAGSRRARAELPAGLALAYLADEEAAVDEWKGWVARLRERLTGKP